ncbi:hypothetical protein FXN65_10555 [Metapseudomonas lalkuanensis]|uniref:Uncharacterized protein n=1 Tax=Metapseudomonas lalkuanensis TaxID=2604832 RepID=A0A5J6QJ04_9GAMM|nr:hypothetical protein [Pseudomonas lalkuanensis]QEY62494.1 hypothetical protein FXN65_10555 [Pseudomonas lalkuanensis]
MLIAFYLSIALIDMSVDAAFCVTQGRKFNPAGAALAALAWPITAPMVIVWAARKTRNHPNW